MLCLQQFLSNYFFTKVNVKCSLQHTTYYFYKSFTVSELVGAIFLVDKSIGSNEQMSRDMMMTAALQFRLDLLNSMARYFLHKHRLVTVGTNNLLVSTEG